MNKNNANLVLKNGTVYAVDKKRSWAQAVAISDGQIVFVGTNSDIESAIGIDTVVIDLNGRMVLPGFVDAHSHPSHGMDYFSNINLYLLDSLDKYQNEISQYVLNHPEKPVYRGSGWSDSLFPIIGPAKEILDSLVPDRPISLVSYDGHSLWVNSIALEKAGISSETPNPDGGLIEFDPETGEPHQRPPCSYQRTPGFRFLSRLLLSWIFLLGFRWQPGQRVCWVSACRNLLNRMPQQRTLFSLGSYIGRRETLAGKRVPATSISKEPLLM